MNFCTRYVRPEKVLEINSGEELVEKEGYIPAEVQIMQMIDAGMRLGQFRKEQFDGILDSEGNIIEGSLDMIPVRSPNFDMADGDLIMRRIEDDSQQVRTEAVEGVEHGENRESGIPGEDA